MSLPAGCSVPMLAVTNHAKLLFNEEGHNVHLGRGGVITAFL